MGINSKYHHLVPQTYLRNWCYQNDSVYLFNKDNVDQAESKNIENNFGLNNYHTIKAGMPSCTEEELVKIFAPLNTIQVFYDGRSLSTLQERNEFYFFWDEWILKYKDDKPVSKTNKNIIKAEIESSKLLDIETKWAEKYENGWNKLYKKIEQEVMNARSGAIDEFYKGKLMKFMVSLDWRSFEGNNHLNEVIEMFDDTINLRKIEIPYKERDIPSDKNALDWAKRNILLNKFRDFLNNEGTIYESAKGYIKNLTLKFWIADGESEFITSDNPSFTYDDINGKRHIMAVSPSILMSAEKDSTFSGGFFIEKINDKEVSKINSIIIMNAYRDVISKRPKISYDKSLINSKGDSL